MRFRADYTLADAARIGSAIGAALRPGDVVLLSGDLGAGKTTLARAMLKARGLAGEAPSPTFAIVQPYAPPEVDLPIAHVDLYRIEAPDEPGIDVFFALEKDAPRLRVATWLAELRRAGVAAETDYAGRSLKGQLTQARRLGAARTVVVGPDDASLRVPGREDETLPHADIVSRLTP